MNLIICGCSGSGKTTAIRRILRHTREPIYGFWTEKLPPDGNGAAPVFIHGCTEPLCYGEDHRIGSCRDRCSEKRPEVFEQTGIRYLRDIPRGSLVLMDEIGVMENHAYAFQRELFAVLDGDYRVLAAIRDRSTPLLDAVRSHPKSLCVTAAEANQPEFLQRALRELDIAANR